MGFLDFLKKEKPAPVFTAENVPPPPPADAALPPVPAPQGLDLPPVDDIPLPPTPGPDLFQDAPKQPDKESIDISEIERKLGLVDDKPSMPEPAPLPPQPVTTPVLIPSQAPASVPVSVPASVPAPDPSTIELPDFTDEDIAATMPRPAPKPVAKPTVKIVTETPIVPAPANAIAMPGDDLPPLDLPTGESLDAGRIEPAKFLSSDTYFMINADIKAARKTLRQSDDAIKEATLRHEQLDQQYKRVASDMHAVQEHLMKVDEALFE